MLQPSIFACKDGCMLSIYIVKILDISFIQSATVKQYSKMIKDVLKPLSHQTAMPQRLYNVQKPCQRAVVSPRNTPKNIIIFSYSVYTTSSQRPYSVHATFPQRLYSVHDVFTARKQFLQRVNSALTARTHRSHGAHTASSW